MIRKYSHHSGILFAILVVSCTLVACSPYVFSDEVGKFSAKIGETSAGYKDIGARIVEEQRLLNRTKWINARPELTVTEGCERGAPDGVICDLAMVRSAGQPGRVVASTPTSPATQPVADTSTPDVCGERTIPPSPAGSRDEGGVKRADPLKSLALYASALAAVTRAQDRADFDSAASKVIASVDGLVQSVAVANPTTAVLAPGIGDVTKAAGNLFFWLVGQSLDYQRLQQLREATSKACWPVRDLADAAGDLLRWQQKSRLGVLEDLLTQRMFAVDRARNAPAATYGAAIDTAFVSVDAFRAVRAVRPTEIAAAMREAHDDLVAAVKRNDGQFAELQRSLQAFVERVNDLAEAVKAAAAANASPAKKS